MGIFLGEMTGSRAGLQVSTGIVPSWLTLTQTQLAIDCLYY